MKRTKLSPSFFGPAFLFCAFSDSMFDAGAKDVLIFLIKIAFWCPKCNEPLFRIHVRVLCRILLLDFMRDGVLWSKYFYQSAYRSVIVEWLQVSWMRMRVQWTVYHIEHLLFASLYRHAWLWLMRFDLFVACVNCREERFCCPAKRCGMQFLSFAPMI